MTVDYDEIDRQLFCRIYESEKELYQLQITDEIRLLHAELEEWEKVEEDLAAKYAVEWGNLRAQYAIMGLLNSGAYQSALTSLQQKYSAANRECSDNIKSINAQVDELEIKKENPHPRGARHVDKLPENGTFSVIMR